MNCSAAGFEAVRGGRRIADPTGAMRGTRIQTHDDHRIAIASFALVGLRVPGVEIAGPEYVGKTFPGYFDPVDRIWKDGIRIVICWFVHSRWAQGTTLPGSNGPLLCSYANTPLLYFLTTHCSVHWAGYIRLCMCTVLHPTTTNEPPAPSRAITTKVKCQPVLRLPDDE